MQIRLRLTLQFLAIVASILLAAMSYIWFQSKSAAENEFFSQLRSRLYLSAAAAVSNADANLKAPALPFITPTPGQRATDNISIYDASDRLVFQFQPSLHPLNGRSLDQVRSKGELRLLTKQSAALAMPYMAPSGRAYIVLAESPRTPDNQNMLMQLLAAGFFGLLGLAAAAGWFFAGQALQPINRIMNEVDRIKPSDLSTRLPVTNQKDEISRLAGTFNAMLGRMEVAFQTQKMFISNVAHELRNPLTVINTQLEVALDKDRPADAYRATLESVKEDVNALSSTSAKLMQMAMLEGQTTRIKMTEVRVDELLWQIKRNLKEPQTMSRVEIDIPHLPEDEADLCVHGNEGLLQMALQNLLENACKFSGQAPVVVSLTLPVSGGILVSFKDQGVGIPQAEADKIFEPFYRGTNTESVRGSGVGLSLVRHILQLHEATITVLPNRPKGTVVEVRL